MWIDEFHNSHTTAFASHEDNLHIGASKRQQLSNHNRFAHKGFISLVVDVYNSEHIMRIIFSILAKRNPIIFFYPNVELHTRNAVNSN